MSSLLRLAAFCLLAPFVTSLQDPVNVQFIGSANCGFTARFLRNQVSIVSKMLAPTRRVNITFFPDSMCHDDDSNWLWCGDQLNALDACVLEEMKEESPEDRFAMINCIQLKNGLGDALYKCIKPSPLQPVQSKLSLCARGYEGRRLLGKTNDIAHERYKRFYRSGFRYPLIFINGERSWAAETDLMGTLCNKYLYPRPEECDTIKRRF